MNAVKPVTNTKLLHVDSSGAGLDVVLLHGWGMHGAYWQGIVAELEQAYRLHCIDLPGHGRSEYAGEQSLDEFVCRVHETIVSLTTEPVYLIGWSLGGLIAQGLTLAYPDSIKRLVLIASSPSFVQRPDWTTATPETVLAGFARDLIEDYKPTLNRFLALQVRGSAQQQQGLRQLKAQLFSRGEPEPRALKAGLSLLQEADLRHAVPAIEQPVLLLGGERDTLVPQGALSGMAALLPNAAVHIVKGAGHAPFLSHPLEMVKLIQAFMGHE